jgi:putative Holliday junction resolvase
MRYLAIDPGEKRTGLALGDDVTGVASPLTVIEAGDPAERLAAIEGTIDAQGPDALVLGLPLNMDGSEGAPARAARQLAETLQRETGLAVHLVDERLTSAAANEQMSRTGLTRGQKKSRRDALAAATILRDFLSQQDKASGGTTDAGEAADR